MDSNYADELIRFNTALLAFLDQNNIKAIPLTVFNSAGLILLGANWCLLSILIGVECFDPVSGTHYKKKKYMHKLNSTSFFIIIQDLPE